MANNSYCLLQRRAFIKYLVGSPLVAAGIANSWLAKVLASESAAKLEGTNDFYRDTLDAAIASTEEALNVFDFERVAQLKLPPAHYGYVATGFVLGS